MRHSSDVDNLQIQGADMVALPSRELFISARISDRRTRRNSPRQTELNREAQHLLILYDSLVQTCLIDRGDW
jgi:hypothetical protein